MRIRAGGQNEEATGGHMHHRVREPRMCREGDEPTHSQWGGRYSMKGWAVVVERRGAWRTSESPVTGETGLGKIRINGVQIAYQLGSPVVSIPTASNGNCRRLTTSTCCIGGVAVNHSLNPRARVGLRFAVCFKSGGFLCNPGGGEEMILTDSMPTWCGGPSH